ncbi:MAG TPA: HD-GYP domain-containing protein [Baekduia sp.]|uniref:HD-GYP domain-containing protein n=1 Tax=Baekduia sp. TaxID=2600305 RepID=UPI002B76686D|nr:HD-GYP domain-containing protein [Baekduia sp.]HMJ32521.1 HD-GYP domain-containing protein [Baekduia sp.]
MTTTGNSGTRGSHAAAPLAHPLLTEVAHQACHAGAAGAAAITRAQPTWVEHQVLAASGDPQLLDDLDVPAREAFATGAPVITRTAATCLLVLDGEGAGTLTLLRPRLRRGAPLRECLTRLTDLATEALRASEAERRLAETMSASVGSLASLLDLRDGYTGQHSDSVVALCEQVASRMGVVGAELEHLRIGAHLHDLGKIGVPDAILHKPGPLDPTEWSIMREHPVWGARALEAVPGFRPAARAVRGHHERWDGGGYPDGLAGAAIPVAARIIAVCDAYAAMTSTRPYRPALPATEARERLVSGTGTQFDPAAVWGLLDALA